MEEELLLEVLDFFAQKLKRHECTKEQLDKAYNAALDLDIKVTADELAKHYGKSRDAVHGVIKRRMIEKPERNVTLYSFKAFRKYVPSSWRKRD